MAEEISKLPRVVHTGFAASDTASTLQDAAMPGNASMN